MTSSIRYALLIGALFITAPSIAVAQWTPFPPPARYPYPIYDDVRGSLRIEVDQKDAEVYVDGYYAGIVDDFDGTFQRLRATTGGHQIVVRLEGFHSIREDVYLAPDATHRIRRTLQPLGPGEQTEPRPTPPGPRPPDDPRTPPAAPSPAGPPPADGADETSDYGTVVLSVQPDGAEILIDGKRWNAPQRDERLVVQLPAGRHHVEVRKNGFAPFSKDVEVGRGATVPVDVSLTKD